MLSLAAYLLLTLVALLWIARDIETINIFDVFGRGYHFALIESPQRWSNLINYGWRLAAVVGLVVANSVLAYRLYVLNPFEFSAIVASTVFVVMLIGSWGPIPWIYVAHSIRWHFYIGDLATELTPFVHRVLASSNLNMVLKDAGYLVDEPWTAWHPQPHEWKADDYSAHIVPVVYVARGEKPSVVFPIDWRYFLAWKLPADAARINQNLPFCGPGGVPFRVQSVRSLSRQPDWCLVFAEMVLEDE